MSVVIKGMEMPKECRLCLFAKTYYVDRKIICLANKEWLVEGGVSLEPGYMSKLCPLVELPEKHGVLIDRDALIRDHFSPEHRIALSEANKTWMRKIINDAPTVVEAEGECG